MNTFGLIGAAGFIAEKHFRAIRDTGNELAAAMDKFDSVGKLDAYFPEAYFFTEFERFDRFLEKRKRSGEGIDYFSVCTPNYLHDAHVRFGLRSGASVICEKPLVLNPWNVELLAKEEEESGRSVFNLLQLRLHPAILALKEKAGKLDPSTKAEIDLAYITPRGKWYGISWKGDETKSGGIATNIGIHFFDMLVWIFGKPVLNEVHLHTPTTASGFLELERARVRWFLSIDKEHLPQEVETTYRSITVNGEKVEFSNGFTDLHTQSYAAILDGKGFRLMEALPSIELVHNIRTAKPIGLKGNFHPMALVANI